MQKSDTDRQDREGAVRFLLYPVIFSPDLASEVDRVCRLFGTYPREQILAIITNVKGELAEPTIETRLVLELTSKPNEPQVRAFLSQVVIGLEAIFSQREGN